MNGIGAIRAALEGTAFMLKWYVEDFSEADMFVRPVPNANHAAWQLGQVIAGDVYLVRAAVPDAAFPELPAGFMELHGKEGATKDDPKEFLTKAEYLKLFDAVRSATIAALEKLSEADLDRPTAGDMAAFAPTHGHVFLAASNHTLMHGGQLTVIRRKLGKPILF
jgi:DinB superfamily